MSELLALLLRSLVRLQLLSSPSWRPAAAPVTGSWAIRQNLAPRMLAVSRPTRDWHSLQDRSRIHERAVSLRFLGIILRGLRLEVSVYNVYITNQF
jgi:hypothetical protein